MPPGELDVTSVDLSYRTYDSRRSYEQLRLFVNFFVMFGIKVRAALPWHRFTAAHTRDEFQDPFHTRVSDGTW